MSYCIVFSDVIVLWCVIVGAVGNCRVVTCICVLVSWCAIVSCGQLCYSLCNGALASWSLNLCKLQLVESWRVL